MLIDYNDTMTDRVKELEEREIPPHLQDALINLHRAIEVLRKDVIQLHALYLHRSNVLEEPHSDTLSELGIFREAIIKAGNKLRCTLEGGICVDLSLVFGIAATQVSGFFNPDDFHLTFAVRPLEKSSSITTFDLGNLQISEFPCTIVTPSLQCKLLNRPARRASPLGIGAFQCRYSSKNGGLFLVQEGYPRGGTIESQIELQKWQQSTISQTTAHGDVSFKQNPLELQDLSARPKIPTILMHILQNIVIQLGPNPFGISAEISHETPAAHVLAELNIIVDNANFCRIALRETLRQLGITIVTEKTDKIIGFKPFTPALKIVRDD